jgi:two-component system nitrate/nitrite response regulator NarL
MTGLNEFQRQCSSEQQTELCSVSERIRILLIDQHVVSLDGLVAGLSFEKDIDVVGFATSFQKGRTLAKELLPEIILLDLQISDAGGPRAAIESLQRASRARIIIFSAEARAPFISAVLDMGVRGYLLKSEGVTQIARAIRSVARENKIVRSASLCNSSNRITKSEVEILKMLARGMKYDDIAAYRRSSPGTVRKQCELLLLKLNLTSREELIACAVNSGYGMLELDGEIVYTKPRTHS